MKIKNISLLIYCYDKYIGREAVILPYSYVNSPRLPQTSNGQKAKKRFMNKILEYRIR